MIATIFCDVEFVSVGKFSIRWYLDDVPVKIFKHDYIFAVRFNDRENIHAYKEYIVRVSGRVHYHDIVDQLDKLNNRRAGKIYSITQGDYLKRVNNACEWRKNLKPSKFVNKRKR